MQGSPILDLDSAVQREYETLLKSKNIEIHSLSEAVQRLRGECVGQRLTIDSLSKRLSNQDFDREADLQLLEERLADDENLKTVHSKEVDFLLCEIAELRRGISQSQAQLQGKTHELTTMKESYERELARAQGEIARMNRVLAQVEEKTSQEVRELTSKRDLDRSRASGVIQSRKESSQYMEKQLRKLNEETLEKTIMIQNLNREVTKERKRSEEASKHAAKAAEAIRDQHILEIANVSKEFQKENNILKGEIGQLRQRVASLMQENESAKSTLERVEREMVENGESVLRREREVEQLKGIIEKMREEHIQQITNLMKERKKKSSNMGSSRSLSYSNVDFNNSSGPNTLAPVKEESPQRISESLNKSMDEEESELARAVFHYDTLIEELKKSHAMELEYYKLTNEKVVARLDQKESQLEDMLIRFSPLVKIHADEKTLEEDRRERIERHWKGDVSILEVMLQTHSIRAFV